MLIYEFCNTAIIGSIEHAKALKASALSSYKGQNGTVTKTTTTTSAPATTSADASNNEVSLFVMWELLSLSLIAILEEKLVCCVIVNEIVVAWSLKGWRSSIGIEGKSPNLRGQIHDVHTPKCITGRYRTRSHTDTLSLISTSYIMR